MNKIELTENEKRDLFKYIEAGKSLPEKYRWLLFEDKKEVELVWNGKTTEITKTVLPFQTIEVVDEPRAEDPSDTKKEAQMSMFNFDERGRQIAGWTNKLIWGDNKLILSSLKSGPLREEIEKAGGLKLIYIDPPFDVGADFSMKVEIGDDELTKKPNVLEELAYRDTWGKGADSFIAMIYERISLMKDLLADDGSIYVHCDHRVTSYMRLVLDEVFGKNNFQREIIWSFDTKSGYKSAVENWIRSHDTILYYAKDSTNKTFNKQYEDYDEEYLKRFKKKDSDGRLYRDDRGNGIKQYLDELKGVALPDVWRDVKSFQQAATSAEYLNYQGALMPEEVAEVVIFAITANKNIELQEIRIDSMSRTW